MSELVLLHHNEPMTTSLAIADGTENTHESVIKLVRKYVEDLQEFGPFGFEIQKSGGRPTEVAYLNEPQATLLITYLRNSETVRRFKIALVKAFYELRDRLRGDPGPQFLTGNLAHGADLVVAADRTFRSFMRAGRSAGMALPAALRVANQQTLARTGMDMLAELGVDPDAVPLRPAPEVDALPDPMTEALERWAEQAPADGVYRMADILREACGIDPASKRFEQQSPTAGRVLRRLGWRQLHARQPGLGPRRLWAKH